MHSLLELNASSNAAGKSFGFSSLMPLAPKLSATFLKFTSVNFHRSP